MSKDRISSKAVSTKGKANRKPISACSIQEAIDGIGDVSLNEELRGAATVLKKSRDAELRELAADLSTYLDILTLTAKSIRGVLAKAKSRAAELEGR